jgi:hypothetical protein
MNRRALLRAALRWPGPFLAACVILAPAEAWGTGAFSDSSEAPGKGVAWNTSLDAYYYALPREEDFTILVGIVEHGSLHLEARYNYEDWKTGSAFVGWTMTAGERLTLSLTPMVGVAFGQTTGVVPALEAGLGYGIADLYLESEYLIDLKERANSFLYSWVEIGLSPMNLFRAGFVAQRTRIFETPLDVNRGLFASVTPEFGAVSVYVLNLSTESWFVVIGARLEW